MADHQDRIDQLNQKLEILLSKQEGFAKELMALYKEIEDVKNGKSETVGGQEVIPQKTRQTIEQPDPVEKVEAKIETEPKEEVIAPKMVIEQPKQVIAPKIKKPKGKSNWEKFIGENLINKIGIAITVIGVAIGAKYSIENDLISPLTRIILGYLMGLGLLGFAIKLKAKYENFSAVLVSGALAILYFITFAAYSFYDLFPQLMAFGLMLVFTVFGVVAAINYNKQIIAHLGLVGAYAVPFLLSNDSGNAMVLFSYMAIINIGVLVISFKKYWKPLYFSAFVFTWLIFSGWFAFSYETEIHFQLALTFLCIFFILFYITLLAYKLKANEKFKTSNVVMLLLNSFVFYGLGYAILDSHETGSQLLGLFTLCNALVHFGVSALIYKKKLADRNLFYLVSGLVLVFITIAIPVQLNGNWVTLLWAMEATLLFWIGRSKNVPVYEYLSYPLMVLALFSLFEDWSLGYDIYNYADDVHIKPILSGNFLTSALFLVAFGIINWVNNINTGTSEEKQPNVISRIMSFAIPGILLLVLYSAFFLELDCYWNQLYNSSEIDINDGSYPHYNYDLWNFRYVWLLNYTLLFLTVLAFVNIAKLKNRVLGIVTLVLGLLATAYFLTGGLLILSELRESYLSQELSEYYESSFFSVGIRYVAIAFFAVFVFALYKLGKSDFMKLKLKIPFEILMHISIIWILSSELLNWMDIAGSDQSYKLGLSILWGVYALLLIALGIWKNKKYLRIGAMALFGGTLLKLFFYDIASLNTIAKTVVFVSLGILLLIISFLYNKYKHFITDEHEN